MSGRYIPPSMRHNQDPSHGGTTDIRLSEPSTDLPARSLEQLSSSQPRQPRERGRGRGRGYGYRREYGRGNAHPRRPRPELEQRPREEGELTSQEIRDHFWLLQYERDQEKPANAPLPPHQRREQSTLNDSWQYKDELSYLLLFPNAHPRWESDGIIFAHTSIDMLTGYDEAFSKVDTEMTQPEMGGELANSGEEQVAPEVTTDTVTIDDTHDKQATLEVHADAVAIDDAQGKQATSEAAVDTIPPDNTHDKKATSEAPADTVVIDDAHDKKATLEAPADAVIIDDSHDKQAALETAKDTVAIDDAQDKQAISESVMNVVSSEDTHDQQSTSEAPTDAVTVEDTHENKTDILSTPQSNEPLISRPMPIFIQTYEARGIKRVYFRFNGWYHLSKVDFLRPRSQELARMMEQKWDIKDPRGRDVQRNKSAWQKSMDMRWAVCQFEKCEEQGEPPAIQIEEKETKQDTKEEHQGNQEESTKHDNEADKDRRGSQEDSAKDDDATPTTKRTVTVTRITDTLDNGMILHDQ